MSGTLNKIPQVYIDYKEDNPARSLWFLKLNPLLNANIRHNHKIYQSQEKRLEKEHKK